MRYKENHNKQCMLINWETSVCIAKIVQFTLNQISKLASMMIRECENLIYQHQIVKINNKERMSSFNYEIYMTKKHKLYCFILVPCNS